MIHLKLSLDDKQYRYLKQRARDRDTTVDVVVADLIEADIAWQQSLADDPVAALFGAVEDQLEPDEIDKILYTSPIS